MSKLGESALDNQSRRERNPESLLWFDDAVWSPDRLRIATHPPVDAYDNSPVIIYAVNSPRPEESVDISACCEDLVVPVPEVNPKLVHDWEVLLGIRDKLPNRASLNWSPDVPILEFRPPCRNPGVGI